jgi:hypothetical protein
MRLWKALHTLYRGRKGVRRAGGPRTRLEVEALDQRLLPSFQWGIGRGLELLSYDLPAHKAGALVSSHPLSGSGKLVNRHVHSPAGMSHVPTGSISMNFARAMRSFSWGEVNSPD